jgi:hypothetical protein
VGGWDLLTDKRTEALLENGEAMERLRKIFYHLWKPLVQVRENPELLEEWRRAPRASIGWRSLIFYEQAIRVLEVSVEGGEA